MYSFILSALIAEKINRDNLGILEATKQIGISYPALRSILKKPGYACHRGTLEKVAKWLGKTPDEILNMASKGLYNDPLACAVHAAPPILRQLVQAALDAQRRVLHMQSVPEADFELLSQRYQTASPLQKALAAAILDLTVCDEALDASAPEPEASDAVASTAAPVEAAVPEALDLAPPTEKSLVKKSRKARKFQVKAPPKGKTTGTAASHDDEPLDAVDGAVLEGQPS